MTTITTRTNKTTELSYAEGDANLDRDVITAAADPGQTDGSDNRSVYECNGTFDFTLPLATNIIDPKVATPWNDYIVTIKNVGSGTITVKTSGTDTLDGVAASGDRAVAAGDSVTYQVNDGEAGYMSIAEVNAALAVARGGTGAATAILARDGLDIGAVVAGSVQELQSIANGDRYAHPFSAGSSNGWDASGGVTERIYVARAVKIFDLQVTLSANTASNGFDIGVDVDGSMSSLKVTMASGVITAKNTSNTVSVPADSYVTIFFDTSAGGSGFVGDNISWSFMMR